MSKNYKVSSRSKCRRCGRTTAATGHVVIHDLDYRGPNPLCGICYKRIGFVPRNTSHHPSRPQIRD